MPKKNQEVTIEHYREMLSKTCSEAITTMQTYLDNNPNANRQKLLEKAYDIATVYGRASGTLAANKYDQDALLAERRGEIKPGKIKEAEIADFPDFGEIARAINGTIKHSSLSKVPETVGRLVKQQAEDTTLKNANRDGAEYAWIPAGDTCVFCLSLAANGWQRATKSTAEGNHADHIHPHCDCTFATRFSKDTQIAGYHPEKIKAFIESQEGDTWAEKLNSLRREQYARKKGLASGNGNKIGVQPHDPPEFIRKLLDGEDRRTVLLELEKLIADEPIENAIVITKDGEIYRCTGTLNGVYPDVDLKGKLFGADVTHNHPVGSNHEYSFSKEDVSLFINYRLGLLRGFDNKFSYELDWNANNVDHQISIFEVDEYSARHSMLIEQALVEGFGYRRKKIE